MTKESTMYEEWLTTIANTRFIYNTMSELENALDNNSIHSNGIKRCFTSQQKMRSAYRDLKVEVERMTDGIVNLDSVILQYKKAWGFFRKHLYRRANPEQIASELLSFCYPPYTSNGIGAKRTAMYQQIIEQNINIPFLLLMLMKAIPGYDSKDGDANYMPMQFEHILDFLQNFAAGDFGFCILPAITRAKEETNKSRLMLLFHVTQILATYVAYADTENTYDTISDIKTSYVNLNINGVWNECGGKLLNTNFWQIENTINYGTYFMTHWHKNADNRLVGIRYTLSIMEGVDGNLIYYILHPKAICHRIKGLAYEDSDQVWYKTAWLEGSPNELALNRLACSMVWPQDIHLTRCTDKDVLSLYNRWLSKECKIVKPYQNFEYHFMPNLYAVTQTPSDNEREFYKIPKDSYDGFRKIQIGDNVGVMHIDGKIYLVFDELLLYIETTKEELHKYKIERVNCIE